MKRFVTILFFVPFIGFSQSIDTSYIQVSIPYIIRNDTIRVATTVYDSTFVKTTVYDTTAYQVTVIDSGHTTDHIYYEKPKHDFRLYVEEFREKASYVNQGDWDTRTIQLALDSLSTQKSGTLIFGNKRGKYAVIDTLFLPLNQGSGQYILDGSGVDMVINSSVTAFRRTPKNNSEANYRIDEAFHFRNFTFRGGKTAIDLGATYGSTINECKFYGQSDLAVKISFSLKTVIRNCMFTGFQNWGLSVQSGSWPGATPVNSQSNQTIVRSCRFYCGQNSDIAIAVLNSSGVRIEDCIIEGLDPNYGIYFDSDLSSVVKYFEIKNLHLECKPKKAGILTQSQGGNIVIDGLFVQHPATLFHFAGPKTQTIRLENIPWIPEGTKILVDNPSSKYVSIEGSHLALSSVEVWNERPYYFDMVGSDQFTGKVWGEKTFYHGISVKKYLTVPTYLTNSSNQKLGFGVENNQRTLYWLYDGKTVKTIH